MAKIAVIGSGISGMAAAYFLHPHHHITLYEKAPRIGGHSRTVNIVYDGVTIPVDTGFIVFNERNYPYLTRLFRHLGIPVHKSDMTYSATIRDGWLEWGAKNLDAVFAQRRNLIRPHYYLMLRDIARFNARAVEVAESRPDLSLGGLLDHLRLGGWFRNYYLLPMSGAIWSCPPRQMLEFPALAFTRFFHNHGLLAFNGQPQWYTVTGGSQEYVRRLTKGFSSHIRVGCGAAEVQRTAKGVMVHDTRGGTESFDHVVMAGHANDTLSLLKDADETEQDTLGAFRYQENRAVLHRDTSVMPRRLKCWASWVYHAEGSMEEARISVSYWMNHLQGIDGRFPLFVTLNPNRSFAPGEVFDEHVFHHPVFDATALRAQPRLMRLQGHRNVFYCGAHMRNGFHEDGLWSAVQVARSLGVPLPWEVPAETMDLASGDIPALQAAIAE